MSSGFGWTHTTRLMPRYFFLLLFGNRWEIKAWLGTSPYGQVMGNIRKEGIGAAGEELMLSAGSHPNGQAGGAQPDKLPSTNCYSGLPPFYGPSNVSANSFQTSWRSVVSLKRVLGLFLWHLRFLFHSKKFFFPSLSSNFKEL